MENRSHALAAGIFTLLLGIAAGLALWWLGKTTENMGSYLLETRRNVNGLNRQAKVTYRGIEVGKVLDIRQDDGDPRVILVEIAVDNDYKLTKGTVGRLGTQGITGLAFVMLDDDGRSAEVIEADSMAPRIPLSPGLADQAEEIVQQIAAVTGRLATVLDEKNAQNLSRTLDNVAIASEGLKELPAVIASLKTTLSDTNMKRLALILEHVEKTAGAAAPLAVEARELLKSMTALSRKVDRLADDAVGEVTATTLQRANTLMLELTTSSRQMNRILGSLEDNPQMLIFGKGEPRPGPGETGFATPGK